MTTLNEENRREQDLVWAQVKDVLLAIVRKSSTERSPEERRTLRAMSFKLILKLEHDVRISALMCGSTLTKK